ncbi:MAG TPA: hypothetical protein VGB59_05740 [Allosphingosinicella sp.]
MATADAKAAIRRKKKSLLAGEDGPRGWIVGPVMCLWRTALSSHGPMVFAWISREGEGTRIIGRAGSDLNGIVGLLLLTPAMMLLMSLALLQGQATTGLILLYGGLLLVGFPLTLWMAHKDRREADPLVNFIRRTIQPAARSPSKRAAAVRPPTAKLILDGASKGYVSEAELHESLWSLGQGEFLILERALESYMQVLVEEDSFILEKREGSSKRHFRAELQRTELEASPLLDASTARLVTLMTDYFHGRSTANDLKWERRNP